MIRLKIVHKLMLLILFAGLFPLVVSSYLSYYDAYAALEKSTFDQLVSGLLGTTNLGKAFQQALNGKVGLQDFEPHAPSNNEPASFVAAPIPGPDGRPIGVLGLQLSVEQIEAIMHERSGLGKTGETYLVGADKLMRSNARFSEKATLLKQRVDTVAVSRAISGEVGAEWITDYHNAIVLSAYAPMNAAGLNWATIAEIDQAEAFTQASALRDKMILITAIAAAIALLFGAYITFSIRRPLKLIQVQLNELVAGTGDLIHELKIGSGDEVGDLASTFNQFLSTLRTLIRHVRDSSHSVSESATSLIASTEETTRSIQNIAGMVEQVADGATHESKAAQRLPKNCARRSIRSPLGPKINHEVP